jgi:TrmH family RNA methyltransferase
MSDATSRTVEILNKRGLHARASAKFVTLASSLPARVEVEKDGARVVGTSIMGLMMLGAAIGVYRELETPLAELDRATSDIWIVAQALRDPGNLGTILRTGDAVGAGGLILIDDCTDAFSVEAVRASMGAIFTQSVTTASWPDFLGWLRSGPGQLVGTSLNTDVDYQAPAYARPTFVLVGNEAQGLPPAYEADCDLLVKMPMRGKADSLNAAVACGVMAYEVLNQHRRSER